MFITVSEYFNIFLSCYYGKRTFPKSVLIKRLNISCRLILGIHLLHVHSKWPCDLEPFVVLRLLRRCLLCLVAHQSGVKISPCLK